MQMLSISKIFTKFRTVDLFKLCLILSVSLHAAGYAGYYLSTLPSKEISSDELKMQAAEVEFEDFPLEFIGGSTRPALVEKQEWIEGTSKYGKDPIEDDVNLNALSGDGTDKEGYLFSYNGDRPPTPIINFDLKKFFPKAAKDANISQKIVVLQVQVDESGNLKSAKIISGRAGYGFDEAAMEIVNLIRFAPGYVNGKPTRMSHKLPINFVLGD